MRHRTPAPRNRLIDALVADARPVRPLWSPARRLAAFSTLAVATLALAAAGSLRLDVGAALRTPATLAQLLLLLAAALAAAGVALRDAVPGSETSKAERVLAAAAVVLALTSMALPATAPVAAASALPPGPQCVLCVLGIALVPGAALLAAMGRGVALDEARAGAWAGVAAGVVGVAATRLACPYDDGMHLLAWHVPPVLVVALIAVAVGRHVLSWPLRMLTAPR